jgi:hypothetical protein
MITLRQSNTLVLILIGVVIFLLNEWSCNSSEPIYIKGDDSIVVVHDTLTDTIYKPVPKYVHRVHTIHDTLTLVQLDSIRLYETYNSDSSVFVQSEVRGLLLETIIHAKLKEVHTYRVDTLKLTNPFKPSLKPLIFATVTKDVAAGLGVGGILTTKKTTFIGGYDLINKNYMVGIGFSLK